jgi:curved DNA-binding protein CbpA
VTPTSDPFRVLGLTAGASLNEIRSAYRRLAKQYHPDTAGERALPRFLAIQAAYERLVDGEGRLRPDPQKPRAPRAGWSADPDRAGATRAAYRARRAGWSSPSSSAPGGTAGTPGASSASSAAGATGPRRRTADGAAPRPGTEWATSGERTRAPGAGSTGTPPPGGESGTRRRRTRTATPGSTTYDEAAETPLDPEWQGAGWYGPASGTYWTINPREYADPRKHGPEYPARARRAAEVEAEQEQRRAHGEPGSGEAAATAPETDAAGASAGWAWTRDATRGTPGGAGAPGTTTDAGAGDWTADAWRYEPEQAYRPTADAGQAARRGTTRGATPPSEPLPDLEALLARLGPRSLRAMAARGDVRSRVVLALIAWPPIGFAAASLLDAVTGCAVFSPGCTQTASMLSVAVQPLIVAALVLLPVLAASAAFATVATLLVTLPIAAALSALLGPDVGMGRGLLVAAAIGTYLAGFVAALLRGGAATSVPPPEGEMPA